ncbi:P-loop containing nucleoside triphosphate hydrolase protein [Mycena leptocephala]|nr:P-loop containing nucleoside triphosphate hydrolase protein [Mycena leptocephala]
MLLAPVPHLWSLLAGFLPSATISQEHEVYYWVLAWVKKNTTSRAILIEDQIKKGQLSGRLTPDIARGVLTRYDGRLLWIKLDAYDVPKGPQIHITVLSIFPGGRSLFSRLLRDSRRAFEARDTNDTITVFTPGLHKQVWAYPLELDCRPWESIHLPEKEQLLQDISKFEDRGDVYQRHGIPWRRGYLLHGPPGTGKTSLVKALAGHRKCPLYIVNLGDDGLTDSTLRTLLERVPRSAMVLIEDLTGPSIRPKNDRVQGVTLPGLLNALDGVTAPERGVTFFITTNDIDGLDPALTRPGRLGYHLKFHSATSGQIQSMLVAHYPEYGPETLKSITDNIELGATMATLQEMILQGSFDYLHHPPPQACEKGEAPTDSGQIFQAQD